MGFINPKDKPVREVDAASMVIERYKDSILIGEIIFYYVLSDYRINHTTPIIGYEFKDGIHYFETYHKLRAVEDEYLSDITRKQIDELKDYLKCNIFKKFIKWHKESIKNKQ
ncbi:MAG: hypothetical protein IJ593_00490 [Lachnospiraceae bacterium]|nr:hypothetical protein [Lachnospiraceae bacterium]